jgi:hypothetical protein
MNQVFIVTDPGGGTIAKITIDEDTTCEMDLSSYQALKALGYKRVSYKAWNDKKYPSFRVGSSANSNHILIARILAGAPGNKRCKYHDGNTLNLRLSNLRIV